MAETKTSQVFGIIGGSGVYDIEGLTNKEWRKVESPFGQPSDALLFGELNGQRMVFLPRHGRGHKIPPSEINFKANIDGGGITGQAEAVRLAISKALIEINPEWKPLLKVEGLTTRDPRMVERKKFGQKKARKRFQFSKR